MGPLYGPRGVRFLMSEIPLYVYSWRFPGCPRRRQNRLAHDVCVCLERPSGALPPEILGLSRSPRNAFIPSCSLSPPRSLSHTQMFVISVGLSRSPRRRQIRRPRSSPKPLNLS